MSRQRRIAVVLVAVVAATFAVGYGVAAQFVHPNLVPPGVSRYAYAGASDPQTTTSTTPVNLPGLSTTFTVPAGRVADLEATFSGELNGCSAIFISAVLNGSALFQPGDVQVFWPFTGSGAAAHSFTFFRRNIGPGTHTVAIQWHELTNCNQAFISLRTLAFLANIH